MKSCKQMLPAALWFGAVGLATLLPGWTPSSRAQETNSPLAARSAAKEISKPQKPQPTLDFATQSKISAIIGKDDSHYHFSSQSSGFQAENLNQGLSADFTTEGANLRSGSNRWGMSLRAYGYGHSLRNVNPIAPTAAGNRLQYVHGNISEWFVNGPLGLEQGFTLAKAPANSNDQPLTLILSLSGDLTAVADPDARSLSLTKNGAAVLRYTGLSATDAAGRNLPAWLEVAQNELRLRVDDSHAQYPLTIDPYTQGAELTSAISCVVGGICDAGNASAALGASVAISADGSTVVVGAPGTRYNNMLNSGAAYVFVKALPQLGGWHPFTGLYFSAKLEPSDPEAYGYFGTSVAISSDGKTIAVGNPNWNFGGLVGAVYAYARPASGWSIPNTSVMTQTAKLTASDAGSTTVENRLGYSVAVSADGSIIAAGAPLGGTQLLEGGVYVYLRPAAGWTNATQNAELTASDTSVQILLGVSISLSNDGSTIVAGANCASALSCVIPDTKGRAYVFAKPVNGWANGQETARLFSDNAAADTYFGSSVAISGDGKTIAVSTESGVADIYLKPVTGWAKVTAVESAHLTVGTGAVATALSSDGGTLAVGPMVFARPDNGWADEAPYQVIAGSDSISGDLFGTAVSMSGDGSTIVVGASEATFATNVGEGKAYVFTGSIPRPAATVSPTSLSFGSQAVGTTSAPQTVTLTNNGAAPLNISLVQAKSEYISTQNCIAASPLPVGGSCSEQVSFAPVVLGSDTAPIDFIDDSGEVAGSVQQSILSGIGIADTTTTTIVSSATPTIFGQAVTFTATVTALGGTPTGSVTFTDGASTLGTSTLVGGTASLTVSNLAAGSHSIEASFGGSTNFNASASSAITQAVNLASSAAVVTPSVNPSYVTQSVTFTVSVTSQFGGAVTGNIIFKQGTTAQPAVPLVGGHATYTTPFATAGTFSITAVYSGDTNNVGSTSPALRQTVKALPAATTTTLVSSGTPAFINTPVMFTAAISSTFGPIPNRETVTFFDSTTQIGTATTAGGTASFTTSLLSAKTHSIKATYAGDATFATSSGTLSQVVSLYTSTTTVTSSLNPAVFGQNVILTATVTSAAPGGPTGTVKFLNGTTSLGTGPLSGGVATLATAKLPAGALTITATYVTDGVTAASSGTTAQTVNQAASTTAVVSSLNPANAGQSVKFTATVSSPTTVPTGSVTFMDGATTLGTATLAAGKATFTTTTLASGAHNITVVYPGNANVVASTSPVLVQTVN